MIVTFLTLFSFTGSGSGSGSCGLFLFNRLSKSSTSCTFDSCLFNNVFRGGTSPPILNSFSVGANSASVFVLFTNILHLTIPLFLILSHFLTKGSGNNLIVIISLFKWNSPAFILWKHIFFPLDFSTKYINNSGSSNISLLKVFNDSVFISLKSIDPFIVFINLVCSDLSWMLILIAYSFSLVLPSSVSRIGKYIAEIILTIIFQGLPLFWRLDSSMISKGILETFATGVPTSDTLHFINILPFHLDPISALKLTKSYTPPFLFSGLPYISK